MLHVQVYGIVGDWLDDFGGTITLCAEDNAELEVFKGIVKQFEKDNNAR